jgi:hypothetical protein
MPVLNSARYAADVELRALLIAAKLERAVDSHAHINTGHRPCNTTRCYATTPAPVRR